MSVNERDLNYSGRYGVDPMRNTKSHCRRIHDFLQGLFKQYTLPLVQFVSGDDQLHTRVFILPKRMDSPLDREALKVNPIENTAHDAVKPAPSSNDWAPFLALFPFFVAVSPYFVVLRLSFRLPKPLSL